MSRKTLQRFKDWTGFFAYTDPKDEFHRGKTLWDLLQLLIIPAVLAGFALWFNRNENLRQEAFARNEAIRQEEIEQRETSRQEAIALDQQQEDALQSYLDKMEDLLIDDDLGKSESDPVVRDVARARTLTVLRGLDPERKGSLISFLYESSLINNDRPIIHLEGADLSNAYFRDTELPGVNLSGANLMNADFRGALLSDANLWRANFQDADLRDTALVKTNLSGADLRGADLRDALFIGANLWYADLRGADLRCFELMSTKTTGVDLRDTDLRCSTFLNTDLVLSVDLRGADLRSANLSADDLLYVEQDDATIMPNESRYIFCRCEEPGIVGRRQQ